MKVITEIDDSTTVSGLPAPSGWVCIQRRRDEEGIFGRAWERTTGQAIRVIESIYTRDNGQTWLHVSVSKPNHKLPTWEDVQAMRLYFIGEHREAYMIFPTADRYVDIAHVLHLYSCLDQPTGVLPHMEGDIGGMKSI